MRGKLIGRIEKAEEKTGSDQDEVIILCPTDEEFEEYRTGRTPLPNGPYNIDFSLLSVEMLWKIVGGDVHYKFQENSRPIPITPLEKNIAKMSAEELKAFEGRMRKIWDIEE